MAHGVWVGRAGHRASRYGPSASVSDLHPPTGGVNRCSCSATQGSPDRSRTTADVQERCSSCRKPHAWWHFEQRLSRFVAALQDGEALILSDRDDESGTCNSCPLAPAAPTLRSPPRPRMSWRVPAGSPRRNPAAGCSAPPTSRPTHWRAKRTGWLRWRSPCCATTGTSPRPARQAPRRVNDAGGSPVSELDLPGPVVVRGFEAGVH